MALNFEYCRSCGEKTEVDPAVPEPDRRCRLCGGPCSGIEEWQPRDRDPGPKRPIRPPDFDAEGHVPAELVVSTCPRCHADIAIDPGRSLRRQRCHSCGRLLKESRLKGPKKKPAHVSRDGVLRRRTRDRVWMPMLGAGIALTMILSFGIWLWARREPEAALPEDTRPAPYALITDLVHKFNDAATPDELLPLIRDPGIFEKPLREWCAAHPGALPIRGRLRHISFPYNSLGTRVAQATVAYRGVSDTLLLTVETPQGYRVDWRAFTGIGDMTVADFVARKPADAVLLMAVVHRSDYYNFAYSDKNAWLCLRVIDGRGKNPFYAYLPRSSEALMLSIASLPEADSRGGLNRALVSSPRALRVRFRTPESAAALMAEIEAIPGEEWYVP